MGQNVIRTDPKTGRQRQYFQGDDGKLYNDQSHYDQDQRTNYLIEQFSNEPSNSIGKPNDYFLRQGGGSMAQPKVPKYTPRMAGANIASAIVGELAPHVVEPARKLLQPAFDSLISTTFRLDANPKIASR